MEDQPSPQQIWKWLQSTKKLQEETYNYFFDEDDLIQYHLLPRVAQYLDWNVTAAVQELAEVREEFSWKPWAVDEPFVNRERILNEYVDVLHFIGNSLVSLSITDEELWEAYRQKQAINRSRAASGVYSAKKGGLSEGSD